MYFYSEAFPLSLGVWDKKHHLTLAFYFMCLPFNILKGVTVGIFASSEQTHNDLHSFVNLGPVVRN